MVAVLKTIASLLVAGLGLALVGCGHKDDGSAPVPNPPGRTVDSSTETPHPPPRNRTPMGGGMTANPSAKSDLVPGSKIKQGSKDNP
jgi:hypothetical protein